jgi:hypothetical protein
MPADGIALLPKRDFGTSRGGGSNVKLHQQRQRAEGAMTAYGTKPTCLYVRYSVAIGVKADIERAPLSKPG